MPVKPTPIRDALWAIGFAIFALLLVLQAIGSFIDWMSGKYQGPREGDQCGPQHHWTYLRSGYDLELSCEKDR
jgi:hypothetical protein